MTFDPHPPRVVRPDKAPPLLMTNDAEARGARRAPACRAWRSSASRPSCRSGIPRRSCARCWSTGCASPKSGSARTSCSATIAPATSRCCAALGARYGFRAEKIDPVRYKDFVVSSTRIRRLVAEGRVDEAGALLGHHYFIDGTVVRGAGRGREHRVSDREPRDRERAAAAGRRLRDDRRRSTAIVHPSVTNIGMRPTFGDVGRADRSRRTSSISTRDLYGSDAPAVVRPAAARRAGVPDVDALRAQIDADCRSARAAVRSPFAVESSHMSRSRDRARLLRAAAVGARRRASCGPWRPTWRQACAEQLGDRRRALPAIGRAALDELAPQRGDGRGRCRVAFEFRELDGELLIEARCDGRSSEVRCPLPA